MRCFYIMLVFIPGLSACAMLSERVLMDSDLLLLPPESAPEPALLKQKVTMIHQQKSQTFMVVSRFTAHNVHVVVLMPTGQRMLDMHYDGSKFEVENLTEQPLPAREILSVMQFALWSEAEVKRAYQSEQGWQTKMTDSQRLLMKNQLPVVQVQLQPNHIEIAHIPHKYRVIIEPLESARDQQD